MPALDPTNENKLFHSYIYFSFSGRLQNLISSSCIEHLDFMNDYISSEMNVTFFKELEHDYIGYQSLTDVPKMATYSDSNIVLTVSQFHLK